MERQFKQREISATMEINASPATVWEHITNVNIDIPHPFCYGWLKIPKPIKARITKPEKGGERVAYFKDGRSIKQRIYSWTPQVEYTFSFTPASAFKVGHLLDLTGDTFRILLGGYHIEPTANGVKLTLLTKYEVVKSLEWMLDRPSKMVLSSVQHFLLKAISEGIKRK